jgi:soluble lytic murein transglycosylase-like protein
LSRFLLVTLVSALAAGSLSAQLAYYVDETGRRIYINPEPKPEAPPARVPQVANTRTAKKKLVLTPAKIEHPYKPPTAPTPAKLETMVEETAKRHDVDANLVKAVIQTESNNNPRAVSGKGALGLMQLMPATARDLGVANVFDPVQNVDGGVRYLKYLLNLFGGDMPLSLAAYNAGPHAVERHGGIPPYRETQEYVKKIGDRYGSLRSQAQAQPQFTGIDRTVDESGKVIYTNLH